MRIIQVASFVLFLIITISCSTGYVPPSKKMVLSDKKYSWQKTSTEHFDIYSESDSLPSEYTDSAKVIFERKFSSLLSYLKIASFDDKLTLFMVESREKMKEITGIETNGLANVNDNTVFSIFNGELTTYGIHEFCHIVTVNTWGATSQTWLSEGLAVSADNVWHGHGLHSLCHYMEYKKMLVPLVDLFAGFSKTNGLIAYPECGSFVRYIADTYGIDIVREIWKKGIPALEKETGKSVSVLEQEWRAEIKKYPAPGIDYP
ncbi:MAG: hypothetical protein U0X39_05935 [Bacteroidales bacterium]